MRRRAALLLVALCVAAPLRAQVADPELAALLERVQFWQERNREDLAREALERALRRSPDDPEALMLLARFQLRANLEREAAGTLERLRAAHPKHPNVARLDALVRIHGPDRERLRQARQLARAGRNDEAARGYRAIFPQGVFPDDDLALEYAQVLGWTREGWDQARDMLADLASRHPNDARYRVALVSHQSTRKPVGAETLKALRELAGSPTVAISRPAKEAWRRAVIAMDPVPASVPALREYIAANPGETAVSERLEVVLKTIAGRGAAPAAAAPAGPKVQAWAAFEAGRYDEAQALFEAALAGQPRDGEAAGGLGLVRMRQGRHAEAAELFARAGSLDAKGRAKWEELGRGARYWLLLQQAREAREAGRLEVAQARAREARELDPADPNAGAEAARVQAAIDARSVARLLEDAKRLQGEGREAEAVAALESAAAIDRDDPWMRLDLARLLARRGEADRAGSLFEVLARRRPSDADARYAHALFLSGIGRDGEALVVLEAIPAADRSANVTRLQRRLWTAVQGRRAVALAQLDRRAEAERLLRSARESVGDDRELQLEIARVLDRIGADPPLRESLDALAASGGQTGEEAAELGRLRLSLRLREAEALDAAGQREQSLASMQAWVPDALRANPGDARLLGIAARLAEREGDLDRAIDLEQRSLAAGGGDVYRFRRLAELLDRQATWHTAALDGVQRSGTAGKSRVEMADMSLGVVRGWSGGGRWSFRMAPTRIASGTADLEDPAEANTFGSALLCRPLCTLPAASSERGVALGMAYETDWLRFDLGTTPLGFPVANVLGGISWKGEAGELGYTFEAARRPVTSTLLSYAGVRDPNTGRLWGGVMESGARLTVSRDSGGENGAWGLAGLYRLTGREVLSNDKAELMAGYYRRLVNEDDRALTAGVTGMLWRFRRSAGEFTFGHGGYYSPRSYESLSFPLVYGMRTERASLVVRGALSVSWSSSRSAPFFPTDEELQARALAAAGTTFTDPFHSGGSDARSFGRALSATWEYQVSPRIFAGGRLELERSSNYTPNRVLLYVRMADRAAARPVALPPEPGLPGWRY